MQMKFFCHVVCLFFVVVIERNFALNAKIYSKFIDEISQNETFLDQYMKWSLKLFSQPDYLYGKKRQSFSCPIESNLSTSPTVHRLRPSDVNCVAALGDSFSTGLAAHALTPVELALEQRGISWSIGGDLTSSKAITLPNLLRQFNGNLTGYSSKATWIWSNDEKSAENRLNFAKSMDHLVDLSSQIDLLIDRLKTDQFCDWKLITLFISNNELCHWCEDSNVTKYSTSQYQTVLKNLLDKLYYAPISRTLVNLVLPFDIRRLKSLTRENSICQVFHEKLCPCASTIDDEVSQYNKILVDLIQSGRYDERDDFTVVIQPFMTGIPIDSSYFAPDCFHFSGKGHSQAALSLWNNMFEPVGGKRRSWQLDQSFKCPTESNRFIFTSKNSAAALEQFQSSSRLTPTSSEPMEELVTDKSTPRHKNHKGKKSDGKSFDEKLRFYGTVVFLFIAFVMFIVAVTKRQNIRSFISETRQRRFKRFDNAPDLEESDEYEVWNRPKIPSKPSEDQNITKTHGTRLSFE